LAVESGAIVCLMLLLSPMSSKAHYVVCLLPCFLVVRRWYETRSVGQSLFLVAIAVTGTFTMKGLLGKTAADATLFWGFPTVYCGLLLVAMWSMMTKRGAGARPVTGRLAAPSVVERLAA
jgi:hypothetical protein